MKTSTGYKDQSHFSLIPKAEKPRSKFDRSHTKKMTMNVSGIYPFYLDEVLPGDTFDLKARFLARLATPIKPIMDNLFADVFYFFVPNRLVWDNWEKFCGSQDNPGDSTAYTIPQLTVPVGGFAESSLADYFGIPTKVNPGGNSTVNQLPFRAYNLIWNIWFKDENVSNNLTVYTDDGPQSNAAYYLRNRFKTKDYFTSCLPWAQKGTAVSIPLGTTAPVVTNNQDITLSVPTVPESNLNLRTDGGVSAGRSLNINSTAFGFQNIQFGNQSGLQTDLSSATAATINSLRQAFQIQRLYERDARGGTRYFETLHVHFGVISPDSRLQRPEYLGRGSFYISVNPIPQTQGSGASGTTTPQGNLSAFGVGSGTAGFSKSFVEHGHVLGLITTRSSQTYQQGLNKMWSRSTRLDYYWPVFAHLGEQAVLGKEIYWVDDGQNDAVYGYQERWAEYRFRPSEVVGGFRSNATSSYDIWHLAYKFTSRPALTAAFLYNDIPIDRVTAVPTEPDLIVDIAIDLHTTRVMPVYSVPGLIDHF